MGQHAVLARSDNQWFEIIRTDNFEQAFETGKNTNRIPAIDLVRIYTLGELVVDFS